MCISDRVAPVMLRKLSEYECATEINFKPINLRPSQNLFERPDQVFDLFEGVVMHHRKTKHALIWIDA